MSAKDTKTVTDFINFDTALNTGIKLMNEKKTELLGFYIIVSILCYSFFSAASPIVDN